MDCSLPGSSVHGIFQPRVLEWGAIAFSGLVQWGQENWEEICRWSWKEARDLDSGLPTSKTLKSIFGWVRMSVNSISKCPVTYSGGGPQGDPTVCQSQEVGWGKVKNRLGWAREMGTHHPWKPDRLRYKYAEVGPIREACGILDQVFQEAGEEWRVTWARGTHNTSPNSACLGEDTSEAHSEGQPSLPI